MTTPIPQQELQGALSVEAAEALRQKQAAEKLAYQVEALSALDTVSLDLNQAPLNEPLVGPLVIVTATLDRFGGESPATCEITARVCDSATVVDAAGARFVKIDTAATIVSSISPTPNGKSSTQLGGDLFSHRPTPAVNGGAKSESIEVLNRQDAAKLAEMVEEGTFPPVRTTRAVAEADLPKFYTLMAIAAGLNQDQTRTFVTDQMSQVPFVHEVGKRLAAERQYDLTLYELYLARIATDQAVERADGLELELSMLAKAASRPGTRFNRARAELGLGLDSDGRLVIIDRSAK